MTWRDEIREHLCEEWPWGAMDRDGLWLKFQHRPAFNEKTGQWEHFEMREILTNIAVIGRVSLTHLDGLELTQFCLYDLRQWDFPISWYHEIILQLMPQPDDPEPDLCEAIDVSYVKNERARQWISDKLKELYG